MTPFALLEARGPLLMTKAAATRRDFLKLLLRNTTGGAAVGAAYKAGMRPLVKDLKHEIGSSVVSGTTMGPASKPAVSPADLKTWLSTRDTAKKRMEGAGQWYHGDHPTRQIEGAANREAFGALSSQGQGQALSRFGKLEAADGAAKGGLLGLGATTIKSVVDALRRG